MPIRAIVRDGRLVVDEPTQLADGTVLNLVVDDEGDDLTIEERASLHARLERSQGEADRGAVVDAASVLEQLAPR